MHNNAQGPCSGIRQPARAWDSHGSATPSEGGSASAATQFVSLTLVLLLLLVLLWCCRKPKTAAEAGKYTLTIQPGVDAAFVTALAMVCENITAGK